MPLTSPQRQALLTDITVTNTAEFADRVAASEDQLIANAYNVPASPDFWVWKTSVSAKEYTGANSIVWTEINTLPAGKVRIFEWLSGGLTRDINPADPNVRAGIDEAFGPSSTTLTNLRVIERRLATRAERLFATGTGSIASPGTLTFEGRLFGRDIAQVFGRGGTA